MSFNPSIEIKQNPVTTSALPFQVAVASMSGDAAKSEKLFADVRKKTLRTLNAIKIVAPILSTLVVKSSNGEEDSVGLFKRLVGQSSEMSELVVRQLGEDPLRPENFWLRNMLERVFCEVLRDQVLRGDVGSLKSVEPVVRAIGEMDWASVSEESGVYESWSTDATVKIALIRAAAPILAKSSSFNFFRTNMDEDLEDILKLLMGSAGKATDSMVDHHAGEKERASLFSVLVVEAGGLYSSAWHACGKQVVATLSNLSDKQLQVLLRDNPSGLPLDAVNEMFEKNFARLVYLSSKLVPQKAGKIDARLRT